MLAKLALLAAPAAISTLWGFAQRGATLELRFNSDMPSYDDISRFVGETIINEKFSRTYAYSAETKWDRDTCTDTVEHKGITIGYGRHYGTYEKRPVIVNRYLDDADSHAFKEHLELTFVTRDKALVRRFAESVKRAVGKAKENFTHVPIYINADSYWERMGKLPLRRLDSVFTSGDAGWRIVEHIRSFEKQRDEHHRLGLPHHLGIMLHGEPGCGKSSLIHAIASELGREIHYLNLGAVEKDRQLSSLMSGNMDWTRTILAIEDIDAAGVKVKRRRTRKADASGAASPTEAQPNETKSPVSLSVLLNTLDGMLCPDGLVVIASTNHHDQLDPALLREGRFDHTIELGKLGWEDFDRMARLFGCNPLDYDFKPGDLMTGAAMRAMILENR